MLRVYSACMYTIGIKGVTRKKLGIKVLISLLDRRWSCISKAPMGFVGDTKKKQSNNLYSPEPNHDGKRIHIKNKP